MSTVVLSSGPVTTADVLSVELVRSIEAPTVILIRWPDAPTVTDPRRFEAVKAAVMSLLDQAVVGIRTREV